jgi:hypothetical protein
MSDELSGVIIRGIYLFTYLFILISYSAGDNIGPCPC